MDAHAEVRLTPAISSTQTLYLDDSPGPRVQRLVRQMSDLGDQIEVAIGADNAISVTAHDRRATDPLARHVLNSCRGHGIRV